MEFLFLLKNGFLGFWEVVQRLPVLDAIVLYDEKSYYHASKALLITLQQLGFFWKTIATFLLLFPTTLLDYLYFGFAKRRHWFAIGVSCNLPSIELQKRTIFE